MRTGGQTGAQIKAALVAGAPETLELLQTASSVLSPLGFGGYLRDVAMVEVVSGVEARLECVLRR